MLRLLLIVASAMASFAIAYWLGPAMLLVCPVLALATVVWSMQDSHALKNTPLQAPGLWSGASGIPPAGATSPAQQPPVSAPETCPAGTRS